MNETALFFATTRGVSRCLEGAELSAHFDDPGPTLATIPAGYTQLYTLEKRAVVACGTVVRYWSEAPWRERFTSIPRHHGTQAFFADRRDEKSLRVTLMWPLRFAMQQAEQLSLRTGDPIVVACIVAEQTWH